PPSGGASALVVEQLERGQAIDSLAHEQVEGTTRLHGHMGATLVSAIAQQRVLSYQVVSAHAANLEHQFLDGACQMVVVVDDQFYLSFVHGLLQLRIALDSSMKRQRTPARATRVRPCASARVESEYIAVVTTARHAFCVLLSICIDGTHHAPRLSD